MLIFAFGFLMIVFGLCGLYGGMKKKAKYLAGFDFGLFIGLSLSTTMAVFGLFFSSKYGNFTL